MTAGLKLLTVSVLLLISACVSTGTKAITDAGVVSQIEVGKSTQADVAALLGYPITASYGGQGEETWHYTRVTVYPTVFAFVPVVKAVAPSLGETSRELAVTFSRDGTVKSLGVTSHPQTRPPLGDRVQSQIELASTDTKDCFLTDTTKYENAAPWPSPVKCRTAAPGCPWAGEGAGPTLSYQGPTKPHFKVGLRPE